MTEPITQPDTSTILSQPIVYTSRDMGRNDWHKGLLTFDGKTFNYSANDLSLVISKEDVVNAIAIDGELKLTMKAGSINEFLFYNPFDLLAAVAKHDTSQIEATKGPGIAIANQWEGTLSSYITPQAQATAKSITSAMNPKFKMRLIVFTFGFIFLFGIPLGLLFTTLPINAKLSGFLFVVIVLVIRWASVKLVRRRERNVK